MIHLVVSGFFPRACSSLSLKRSDYVEQFSRIAVCVERLPGNRLGLNTASKEEAVDSLV